MKKSILTIKDPNVSSVKVAHWLSHHSKINTHSELSLKEWVAMAKKAVDGETLKFEELISDNEFFNVQIVEELSEDEMADKSWRLEQQKYWELLEEGKNGNAQAAIEFCKAVAEHKVSFGAYA